MCHRVYLFLCLCVGLILCSPCVYVLPCLCVTMSMLHRVYVSPCLLVGLIPCCPCVYVSICQMSMCHNVHVSPFLCVTVSMCGSDPVLFLCLCVPIPVQLHMLCVRIIQKPRLFQCHKNKFILVCLRFLLLFFIFID